MSDLPTLYIGNKNYSSWSLRAWFYLKASGAPFREVRLAFKTPAFRETIAKVSPTGLVPTLVDGDLSVWDSLSICEYWNEHYVDHRGWPSDRAARAVARSVSAEMHAGFAALRAEMPMNCRAHRPGIPFSARALADAKRVLDIWRDCRTRFGQAGPWLFGAFSIADAMYAPVVFRFNTYAIDLDEAAAGYMETVLSHDDIQAWLEAARAEPEVEEAEERYAPGKS